MKEKTFVVTVSRMYYKTAEVKVSAQTLRQAKSRVWSGHYRQELEEAIGRRTWTAQKTVSNL